MSISREEFRAMHNKEGWKTCMYCGNQINGQSSRKGASFIFEGGCPNEEHKLWKEMTEYLDKKEK